MNPTLRAIPAPGRFRHLAALAAIGAGALLASNAWAQAVPLAERLLLCSGCHNPDGNSVIPDYPKLAGIDAAYLTRQLKDIKSGDRKSPIMSGIVAMVDEKEFSALAEFFSEQKPKPPEGVDPKTVAAGKDIYDEGITASAVPACAGCHNEDGSGTEKYPRLAGQHEPYVVQQLLNLKSGERANGNAMTAVAKRLTEDQMRLVAKYIASLKESDK